MFVTIQNDNTTRRRPRGPPPTGPRVPPYTDRNTLRVRILTLLHTISGRRVVRLLWFNNDGKNKNIYISHLIEFRFFFYYYYYSFSPLYTYVVYALYTYTFAT